MRLSHHVPLFVIAKLFGARSKLNKKRASALTPDEQGRSNMFLKELLPREAAGYA